MADFDPMADSDEFRSWGLIDKTLLLEDSKNMDFRRMTSEKLMNFYVNCDDPLIRIEARVQLENRGFHFE